MGLNYVTPQIEVIELEVEDVLCTSGSKPSNSFEDIDQGIVW